MIYHRCRIIFFNEQALLFDTKLDAFFCVTVNNFEQKIVLKFIYRACALSLGPFHKKKIKEYNEEI